MVKRIEGCHQVNSFTANTEPLQSTVERKSLKRSIYGES